MTRSTLSTRRRTALAVSALSAALVLTACGGSTASSAGAAPADGSSSAVAQDAPFNDVDVAFVEDMKPHHAQAVEMADLVLAAGPGPEVAALATRIKAAQTPEIAELEALAEAFGLEQDGGGHSGGHSMSGGMSGMTGTGMMSDQDMAALEAATGAEASGLFLEGMVVHHEGALEMAEAELAGGENPDAKDLAARIKAAQQGEITEMQALLQDL